MEESRPVEPEPLILPPAPPPLKRAKRPARAAQPEASRTPPTQLDLAANMLNLLRLEQAERQARKAELYRSWVQ